MSTIVEPQQNTQSLTSSQVLRLLRRPPKLKGNGSDHRSMQLQELIHSTGYEIVDVFGPIKGQEISKYISGLEFLIRTYFQVYPFYNPIYPIKATHFYRIFKVLGEELLNYKQTLKSYTGEKLLVWEFTDKLVAPYFLKKRGFKIISVPHNIESLEVDLEDLYNCQKLSSDFEKEVKYLGKADAVFAISREEQWLLSLYGIKADFLPYYPPQPLVSDLLSIRQKRATFEPPNAEKQFLVLGTARHIPTFQGMVAQLKTLENLAQHLDFKVDIAGYGTEKLKDYCNHPCFKLHGTVSDEQLEQLMIETQAVLLEQTSGVGALTRIPEMLIAGIPVIANGNACRSAFSYDGVYGYDSDRQLRDLMSADLEIPKVLERPFDAERRFVDCLLKLAQSK